MTEKIPSGREAAYRAVKNEYVSGRSDEPDDPRFGRPPGQGRPNQMHLDPMPRQDLNLPPMVGRITFSGLKYIPDGTYPISPTSDPLPPMFATPVPPPRAAWICPRCKASNAPHVDKCGCV